MRLFACIIAAAFVMATPAQAAWTAHKYPELGFGVDFPAEPKMSKGEYRAVVAGRVPTTVISAELDDTTYQVVIADFTNRPLDAPTILMEAAFLATQDGKVLADTIARTDNGQKFAKYGRRVSVMTKEGGKKTSEVYFVNGRLLMFDSIISPRGDIGNPEAARFQDSIMFNLERDWTIPPALPANPADGPRLLAPVRPGQPAAK